MLILGEITPTLDLSTWVSPNNTAHTVCGFFTNGMEHCYFAQCSHPHIKESTKSKFAIDDIHIFNNPQKYKLFSKMVAPCYLYIT